MPTAKERMLFLSPLAPGATARAHFLAIEQNVGGGGEPVFVPVSGELLVSTDLGFLELDTDKQGELEVDSSPSDGLQLTADDELLGLDDGGESIIEI